MNVFAFAVLGYLFDTRISNNPGVINSIEHFNLIHTSTFKYKAGSINPGGNRVIN
jgi:hypothetical protein